MRKKLLLGITLFNFHLLGWSQQDSIVDQHLQEVAVTGKLPLVEMSVGKATHRIDALCR